MRRALRMAGFAVLVLCAPAQADAPSLSFGIVDLESVDLDKSGTLSLSLSTTTAQLESELVKAIAGHMRAAKPKLFGTISLGVVRYRSGRLVPTSSRVWIDPKDTRKNSVHYEIETDIVAEQESLSVDCERDGWKLRCSRNWVSEGTMTIATAEATGSIVVTARTDTRLTQKPLHLKLYASRVSGAVLLGVLGEMSLSLDIGETLLDEMDVGLPSSLVRQYPELDNWVLRSLSVVRSKKKSRLQLNIEVARRDDLE